MCRGEKSDKCSQYERDRPGVYVLEKTELAPFYLRLVVIRRRRKHDNKFAFSFILISAGNIPGLATREGQCHSLKCGRFSYRYAARRPTGRFTILNSRITIHSFPKTAPGAARTRNLRLRRPTLYPVELRALTRVETDRETELFTTELPPRVSERRGYILLLLMLMIRNPTRTQTIRSRSRIMSMSRITASRVAFAVHLRRLNAPRTKENP